MSWSATDAELTEVVLARLVDDFLAEDLAKPDLGWLTLTEEGVLDRLAAWVRARKAAGIYDAEINGLTCLATYRAWESWQEWACSGPNKVRR